MSRVIRHEQEQVARFGFDALEQLNLLLDGEILADGSLDLAFRVFGQRHPRQALRADRLGDVFKFGGQLAQRRPADQRHLGRADHLDRLARFDVADEDREGALSGDVAHVHRREVVAQVGLIRAVLLHRLGVGDALEGRVRRLALADFAAQAEHQPLDQLHHVLALDEAHFEVKLGEFGLAVAAQVFVAEAAGDLEIALVARHHQQLLQLLRALRQRVEAARLQAAGHEEVARAFGRRLEQDRRLDFEEVALVEIVADELDDLVAQNQLILHPRAAQIEIAIAHPRFFVDVFVAVDQEGRRFRRIQNGHLSRDDFDVAGGKLRIGRPFRAQRDRAVNLNHVLAAEIAGDLVRFRLVFLRRCESARCRSGHAGR